MRIKVLTREATVINIDGLTERKGIAYCGKWGNIRCTYSPKIRNYENGRSRKFSVSGSKALHNGGGYTMKTLRKTILGSRKTRR